MRGVSPKEAAQLQKELAAQVRREPLRLKDVRSVAGTDISYDKHSDHFFAGVVVLRLSDLETIEEVGAEGRVTFPYVPGLLSFREGPILMKALAKLRSRPDVFVFDGQGYAHPRRFGLACHMGVLLDRPSLGCAKSILIGEHGSLGKVAGSHTPLMHKKERVGTVLRTRDGVKPVYLSVGHRIRERDLVPIVRRTCGGYRIPEPTRRAHLLVNRLRRGVR